MRVSLKQNEITQAIAIYLSSKGLANVRASDLDIKYTTTRVGADAGISAEFEIPDAEVAPSQERRSSGEAGTASPEAPKASTAKAEPVLSADEAEALKQPGNTASGGFTPAEVVDKEPETAPLDAATEVQAAQAEDAAADAAEAKPEKESLFG